MGIEDDFYATIKLKSGEELFCKVAASEEEDKTLLIVSNPIIVSELKGRNGTFGYKLEPWLKTTSEDMFIINIDNVLTMSESNDIEMIVMYQQYVREPNGKDTTSKTIIDKSMGSLGNVNDFKEILEKLYKSS